MRGVFVGYGAQFQKFLAGADLAFDDPIDGAAVSSSP